MPLSILIGLLNYKLALGSLYNVPEHTPQATIVQSNDQWFLLPSETNYQYRQLKENVYETLNTNSTLMR
jgi:hypothetical protein